MGGEPAKEKTMRKDYNGPEGTPRMKELAPQVHAWVQRVHGAPPVRIDWAELLENRDAPDAVLEYAQCVINAEKDWEDGAKDRPYSRRPDSYATRLFDGPTFIDQYLSKRVYALFPTMDGEDLVSVDPWGVYADLIARDDEAGCRKLAAALYEWMQTHDRVDAMLVRVCNELKEKS
jgi:hypothetical protein